MPRFSDLAKQSRRLSFDFLGTAITLDYSPSRTTGKMMRRIDALMQESAGSGNNIAALDASYEFLCTVVSWWDVKENDNKTMFPLLSERLDELPTEFIFEATSQITNDAQEKKALTTAQTQS